MTWYMAVLVRGSFVDGELDDERLGDKLFKLIEASDAETAYLRALAMGEASADDYTDDDGQSVRFQFLGLADLREIDAAAITDGTEVYSDLISSEPRAKVVAKEYLTVFETDEDLDAAAGDSESFDDKEAEPEDDSRFSSDEPIR
ncbi:MAG: DUF4288 domain-containing protein [Acidobacteriota bacterium]